MTAQALLNLFTAAAAGRFPAVDGGVTYFGRPAPGLSAVVCVTGHAFVASDLSADALADLHLDGFGRALAPEVLLRLAGDDGVIGVIDALVVAHATGPQPSTAPLPPRRDLAGHPRVRYAASLRQDVQVFGDERGFITLSSGLAGRRELSIELLSVAGAGAGRALLQAALALDPPGTPVFAAISPGNARSLRCFLAAGFVPIGSEVIIQHRQSRHEGTS